MPNPAVTLKLKQFRRRFGITAPRVTVRAHVGWPWYAAGIGVLVAVVAVVVWWFAQRDEVGQLRAEIASLRGRLEVADKELASLRSSAGTEQNVVQMERTAQQQLLARLKGLEQENGALKEELSLFERLVPADGARSVVRIERLNVVPGVEPGRFRYRLLVAYQPSKQEREFKGRLHLVVTSSQGGREVRNEMPGLADAPGEFAVETRHFLRKEGGFSLPPGAKLKSVEARLLQAGTVRATQVVNF